MLFSSENFATSLQPPLELVKLFKIMLLFQMDEASMEYRSLFMLCLAYERVEFIETFFNNSLHEMEISFSELELLYGFGYVDGKSWELLKDFYYDNSKKIDEATHENMQLCIKLTNSRRVINMETSREALNDYCERIRKSQCFFPQVKSFPITFVI